MMATDVCATALIATYNTHGGVGLDRRYSPSRIAGVLSELQADVIALQELHSRSARCDMLKHLRERTGYHAIAGPTLLHADSESFGNGLLSRFPIVSSTHITLAVGRREPRAAIDAVLDCDGIHLRVIATHLGLRSGERREQIARLLDHAGRGASMPTVLLGDINEWLARPRALHALHAHFGEAPARATFPSLLPMLALDRIWMSPASGLRNVRVHRSRLARRASDHLPLLAEIALERGGAGAPIAQQTVRVAHA
jgi:endonuclease/exonuclease/phosphatase family metal-dependent hydrolase